MVIEQHTDSHVAKILQLPGQDVDRAEDHFREISGRKGETSRNGKDRDYEKRPEATAPDRRREDSHRDIEFQFDAKCPIYEIDRSLTGHVINKQKVGEHRDGPERHGHFPIRRVQANDHDVDRERAYRDRINSRRARQQKRSSGVPGK